MTRCVWGLVGLLGALPAYGADWIGWRGPDGNGVSAETGLVSSFSPEGDNLLWTYDLKGRGTPVVFDDTVYVFGYEGEGADVVEALAAIDLATGKEKWKRTFRDFLSDIIYDRYSIGAPGVDPQTGNVYVQSSAGVLMAYAPDGTPLWEVSMMEAFGRLTFPNGRTGAPVIDDERVIVHGITANWGRQGPARDRFYAFDKRTGELLWSSTPGTGPKDSSFSTPLLEDRDGRRLLYAGTGCGHVVAVDARTGEPVWRFRMSVGGVNVSPVVDGDMLVAVHAKENLDSTKIGRMVALDLTAEVKPSEDGSTDVLDGELWRADLAGFSSSPVLHDGIVYQVIITGEVVAVEAKTGTELWRTKLGPDQLHASPLLADGKLYVPLRDGSFHTVKAGRDGGAIEQTVQLEGSALGAPALAAGRILVHTTEKLYAFGAPGEGLTVSRANPKPGTPPPASARVRPAELLLRPGEKVDLQVDVLGKHGVRLSTVPAESAEWWIPPTAKVKAQMDASFEDGAVVAAEDAGLSAGAWKVSARNLTGTTRGRTVVGVPYTQDFEGFELSNTREDGSFAYPPLPWTGARFKWEVRELGGSQVLAKTLDRMIFQRATSFIGHPDERNYRLSAKVRTDGNRRSMSNVGLVNQRYLIVLKANQRLLEISSNQERLKESVPFTVEAGGWYHLATEVEAKNGVTTVRAKVWPAMRDEPKDWTIEIEHVDGHTHGAPGFFGFSPRNLNKVYIDDITLEPIAADEEAK